MRAGLRRVLHRYGQMQQRAARAVAELGVAASADESDRAHGVDAAVKTVTVSVCPAVTGSAAASEVQLVPAAMRTWPSPPKVTVRSVSGSMPRIVRADGDGAGGHVQRQHTEHV